MKKTRIIFSYHPTFAMNKVTQVIIFQQPKQWLNIKNTLIYIYIRIIDQ
jgi:hypothetical protein